jgi:hypothetical protein
MDPIIRDGAEYEFSLFMDLDTEHQAFVSKDRTSILDGQYFVITPDIGKRLAKWLDGAVAADEPEKVILSKATKVEPNIADVLMSVKNAISGKISEGISKDVITETVRGVAGTANYNKIIDIEVAKNVFDKINSLEVDNV